MIEAKDQDTSELSRKYTNLASSRLGAKVVFATDDFFAPKERLLSHEDPIFIPGRYDEHGKWMDGWESRRKRGEGYDYCIVRLGVPGVVKGVVIDTRHFTGNYPPAASLDACVSSCESPDQGSAWIELIPAFDVQGDAQRLVTIDSDQPWTHLRLNIYPDGGVARLRVYGVPKVCWSYDQKNDLIDLAAALNGGRCIAWNDAHFGAPANLLAPGRGADMGDGWETRRRREPGADWVVIALGHPGEIKKVEIDTAHFKGNYPDQCSLQGALVNIGTERALAPQSLFWRTLLPLQKMGMDRRHLFEKELVALGTISHVRFNIHPDGGVSRLRLLGTPTIVEGSQKS